MYLYEKKEDSLNVYSFTASSDVLRNYRLCQMEQIPEKERIMSAITCIKSSETPLFEHYTGKKPNYKILNSNEADKNNSNHNYHVLKSDYQEKFMHNFLLNSYYEGYLKNKNMVRIQYLEKIKYFLLKNEEYDFLGLNNHGNHYQMNEIIQIPESLYILQLLEQERFSQLENENIDEQLSLYTLSKIDELGLKEIKKVNECGLLNESLKNIFCKIENDKKMLKLLKK